MYSQEELERALNSYKHGDDQSLKVVYFFYYNKLLKYGCLIAKDEQLVEDVIQDLFHWIIEHRSKLKDIRQFDSYLFRAFKQNLIRKLASQVRSQNLYVEYSSQIQVVQEGTPMQNMIDTEDLDLHNKQIDDILESLPQQQKEVLYLRYLEGKSYQDISDIMALSKQVIRNYVYRALSKLKQSTWLERISVFLLFIFSL